MLEEFNLFYTLALVGLFVVAYLYLNRAPPPPPKLKITPVENIIRVPPKVKPPDVIPADTVWFIWILRFIYNNNNNNNIILKKGKIKILFGTQTGTAEDFSHTLAKEAKRHHIYAQVIDMEHYDTVSI